MHEVLSPIPYVQQTIVHHPSPSVVVHDVVDAPNYGCEYYHSCGGLVAAYPHHHVHHSHTNVVNHKHHVRHVHHKKDDLALKMMAAAALDKINQKDNTD